MQHQSYLARQAICNLFPSSTTTTGFRRRNGISLFLSSSQRLESSSSNSFISLQPRTKSRVDFSFTTCVKKSYQPRNQSFCDIDQTRFYGSQASPPLIPQQELSQHAYEEIVDESLEALYTYFDEILESSPVINGADVSYSSGVLTIKLGQAGTYVINKQTPNRQIWLSSPTSGPKRYDYVDKTWIYKHDGVSLYALLNSEIPKILGLNNLDFEKHCNIHQN